MKLTTGLNPYGLTYYLGLQGSGTPRHNPDGVGLEGFIKLTEELGGKAIELWEGWLKDKSDAELAALKQRLDGLGWKRIVSSGLQHGDMDMLIHAATALDARYIRVALTPILCGDRAAAGQKWHDLVASVHEKLEAAVPKLTAAGVVLLIENHQDFTSRELVNFCDEYGPNVRIVFDMANTFPVGESPLDFTRVIAPYVRHCHVKDYRAVTASAWSVALRATVACRTSRCSTSSPSTMTRCSPVSRSVRSRTGTSSSIRPSGGTATPPSRPKTSPHACSPCRRTGSKWARNGAPRGSAMPTTN